MQSLLSTSSPGAWSPPWEMLDFTRLGCCVIGADFAETWATVSRARADGNFEAAWLMSSEATARLFRRALPDDVPQPTEPEILDLHHRLLSDVSLDQHVLEHAIAPIQATCHQEICSPGVWDLDANVARTWLWLSGMTEVAISMITFALFAVLRLFLPHHASPESQTADRPMMIMLEGKTNNYIDEPLPTSINAMFHFSRDLATQFSFAIAACCLCVSCVFTASLDIRYLIVVSALLHTAALFLVGSLSGSKDCANRWNSMPSTHPLVAWVLVVLKVRMNNPGSFLSPHVGTSPVPRQLCDLCSREQPLGMAVVVLCIMYAAIHATTLGFYIAYDKYKSTTSWFAAFMVHMPLITALMWSMAMFSCLGLFAKLASDLRLCHAAW